MQTKLIAKNKLRIHFVDTARGIFLYWMIVGHSLHIAGVPREDPLWFLRPGGWATTCFIMLSGLSIALVFFESSRGYIKSRNKLLHRTKEIAIIAYVSNLLFTCLKLILESSFSTEAFIKIALFQYPWGISAVLIPVVFVLLLSPLMMKIASVMSPWLLFTIMVVLNGVVALIILYAPEPLQNNTFFQICFLHTNQNPYEFFPFITFTSLSLFSFSVGVLLKKGLLKQKHWIYIMPISMVIFIGYKISPLMVTIVPEFIITFIKFFVGLGIAFIICHLKFLSFLQRILGLMGRSSLLIFIAHRIFIQSMNVGLSPIELNVKSLALIMIITTLGVSILTCWIKESNKDIARRMKKIGF